MIMWGRKTKSIRKVLPNSLYSADSDSRLTFLSAAFQSIQLKGVAYLYVKRANPLGQLTHEAIPTLFSSFFDVRARTYLKT